MIMARSNNKGVFGFKGTVCNAFTLVELLIVIGILVLLIGILLPTLGRARAAGQRAVCKNNFRNIGMALIQYYDHWDKYPICSIYWTPTVPVRQLDIKFVLKPYLDNQNIFKCPTDTRGRNNVGWHDTYENSFVWHNSYSNMVKGQKTGYIYSYDSDKKLTMYKVPMLNDVVPNHHNLRGTEWPRKTICGDVGGGWEIQQWLSKNQDSLDGFDSLWPDGHVENGLGSDYIRYLKDISK